MQASDDRVLHHYCPTEAFFAIVDSRSIRLTSALLSNDSMEGKIASPVIDRLAQMDSLSAAAQAEIRSSLSPFERAFEGLTFCLSEQGDLLSQWRGYAADGTGVCLGFSKSALVELSDAHNALNADDPTDRDFRFALHRVLYSDAEHESAIRPFYEQAKYVVAAQLGGTSGSSMRPEWPDDLRDLDFWGEPKSVAEVLFFLFRRMYVLKSPAFIEEREWRLLSFSVRTISDWSEFHPKGDKIVPFRAVSLQAATHALRTVTLGPKHQTPPHVVAKFLALRGFGDARVEKSTLSYR